MSIGSTIVPGSNGNTLVIPDRRRRGSGEVRLAVLFFVHVLINIYHLHMTFLTFSFSLTPVVISCFFWRGCFHCL